MICNHWFIFFAEYTLLVPTDAAFAKIPKEDLDAVLNNDKTLMDVVQYHMIIGMHVKNDFLFGKHLYLNSTNGHVIRVYRTAVRSVLYFVNWAIVFSAVRSFDPFFCKRKISKWF